MSSFNSLKEKSVYILKASVVEFFLKLLSLFVWYNYTLLIYLPKINSKKKIGAPYLRIEIIR